MPAVFFDVKCYEEMIIMTDEIFMREALNAAAHARGRTSPNPMVGAVVVRDGRIVAIGWHRQAGTPHAEVHALNMAGELARGSTLYVTLEPCSHFGRTPPCVDAIINAGIKRVVAAMSDPNPKVAGRGFERLRSAGIDVTVGVLENEARRLNEVFLKWITTGLPFVMMKTAMTLDGKIATSTGQSKWITSSSARRRVHEWRNEYDGIMVGIGTVLADNPSLTARLDIPSRNPIRIIVDSRARTPLDANVVIDGQSKTIIAVSAPAPKKNIDALMERGVEIIIAGDGEHVDLKLLMRELATREITSVMVEGGGTLNFGLLSAGLVDRINAFIAPKVIGGRTALTAVEGEGFPSLDSAVELIEVETEMIGGDILISGRVRRGYGC